MKGKVGIAIASCVSQERASSPEKRSSITGFLIMVTFLYFLILKQL
ncbi:hypothetical protein BH18THE2_BH18THE2_31420 [soil metagenome]